MMRRWWYPQKTVAICAANVGSAFWVHNILGLCSWCVAAKTNPWLACFHYISEPFDGYQTILETLHNLLRNPQNFWRSLQTFLRNLQIFFGILTFRIFWGSSEFSEDPQNFLRIIILRILWGSSEFSEDPHPQIFWVSSCSEFSEDRHPQNFISIFVLRFFWGSSEISEDEGPRDHLQKFEKIVILRIFWGSSEFSFNKRLFVWKYAFFFGTFHQQNAYWVKILRILRKLRMTIFRKFWGLGSSENSEDDDPQKILRMLRKFWGWRSSENADDPQKILRLRILRILRNSEDDDPQKILRMMILRKFWGWWSSENFEDLRRVLRMTILRKFSGVSRFSDNHQKIICEWQVHKSSDISGVRQNDDPRQKMFLQEQSQAGSTPYCVHRQHSVFYLFCLFSLTIKAISIF